MLPCAPLVVLPLASDASNRIWMPVCAASLFRAGVNGPEGTEMDRDAEAGAVCAAAGSATVVARKAITSPESRDLRGGVPASTTMKPQPLGRHHRADMARRKIDRSLG